MKKNKSAVSKADALAMAEIELRYRRSEKDHLDKNLMKVMPGLVLIFTASGIFTLALMLEPANEFPVQGWSLDLSNHLTPVISLIESLVPVELGICVVVFAVVALWRAIVNVQYRRALTKANRLGIRQ